MKNETFLRFLNTVSRLQSTWKSSKHWPNPMVWQLAGYRYPQRYSKISSEHKKKFRNCSLAQQLFRNATQPRWWPFACINSLMNQLKNKDVCFTPNRYFFPSAWLSANICCTKANCIKSRKRKKKGKKNLYVLRQNAFLKPHWPWRPLGFPKGEKRTKNFSELFLKTTSWKKVVTMLMFSVLVYYCSHV